jgi:hypothetical protein
MMRRNSPLAKSWVKLLAEQGVTLRGKPVTDHRIEHLSDDGIVPPADALLEDVVSFFRALDALNYGGGKQADETSLRMLAQGFGNERSRFVLAANVLQVQQELVQLDGDALPSEIVGELESDTGTMKMLAPIMKRVFAALADVPVGGRDTYTGELLIETSDARKASFFDEVGRMMSGEPVTDPDLMYDVAQSKDGLFGPDRKHYQRVATPDEIAIVEGVTDQLAAAFGSLPEMIASTPMIVLAQAAVMAKAMFAIVPENAVPGFDDRRREVLAAFMAPLLIGVTRAGWAPHPDKVHYLDIIDGGDPAA